MRLPLLWCRSKVEVAELVTEFRPDMEPTVVLSVGRLIFSNGFMFLSLLSLSRFTIFSVSLLRSVCGSHRGTWASPIPSSSLNFPSWSNTWKTIVFFWTSFGES